MEVLVCYNTLDRNQATVFDLTPKERGFFQLSTLVPRTIGRDTKTLSLNGRYRLQLSDFVEKNDTFLWKNDHRQVYNSYGRYLWWDGNNRWFIFKLNLFLTNCLCFLLNFKEPFFVRPSIYCGLVINEPFFWECKWEFQYV
jgi:hypothetical protein